MGIANQVAELILRHSSELMLFLTSFLLVASLMVLLGVCLKLKLLSAPVTTCVLVVMGLVLTFPAAWLLPLVHSPTRLPLVHVFPLLLLLLVAFLCYLERAVVLDLIHSGAVGFWLLLIVWGGFAFVDAVTLLAMTDGSKLPASRPLSPSGAFAIRFTTAVSLFDCVYEIRLVSPRVAPLGRVLGSMNSQDPTMITNSLVAWSDDSKTMAVWHGGVPIYACEFRGGLGKVDYLHVRSCGYSLPMPGSTSREATVAQLLTNGFSVQDFFDDAARKGDVAALKLLKRYGSDPNGKNNSRFPPLALTILHDRYAATVALLEMGADPNSRDSDNQRTPLMKAASYGNEAVIRSLLVHGANKRLVDKEGKTAADFAKLAHREQITRLIETY